MRTAIEVEDLDLEGEDNLTLFNKIKYGTLVKSSLKTLLSVFAWFFFLLVYMESVFHIWAFGSLNSYFGVKILLCIPTSFVLAFIPSFLKKLYKRIIISVFTFGIIFWYLLNTVYSYVFKMFFNIEFFNKNNAKVYQYYREIIEAIKSNLLVVLLMIFIPVFLLLALNILVFISRDKVSLKCIYIPFAFIIISVGVSFGILPLFGEDEFSPYSLIFNENDSDASFENVGVINTNLIQAKNMIKPPAADLYELDEVWVYEPFKDELPLAEAVSYNDPEIETVEEIIEETIKKTVDRSPNILDIDFVSLAENETDSLIADIHRYFATVEPTNKNEYTGMFKGYNLIFLTCEAFCNIAVDEEYTPTLYKLTHEGIVCNNFYNPRTGGSTSDGEFVNTTSLLPACGGAKNYKMVGQNSMPFSIGNEFNRTYNIVSKAFHDNDYQYYGRDISYPAMGYSYKGVGNGVEISDHWPESDLEMMEATIPDFIDDDLFNVYYMTVSGHLNYNFKGNYCASKHYDEVKDMPYSNACKAYLACQKELDLALEYLLGKLEEKGILDRTVICFTGDHWPYGLSNDEFSELLGHPVEENFELYKSNLVLYCASIEEPIFIDKPCCSLDILPTLLNLFGFDYDSRLLMGRDILSDSEGFVRFLNKSYITDKVMYNSHTGEYTYLTEEEVTKDYLDRCKKLVNQRWNYSLKIIENDYYKYICDACGIQIETVPQNYEPDYSKFSK